MVQQIIAGLQSGSTYAMLALAVVLILKATDVPNFATAEMGLVPVFVIWQLLDSGWNYWLAVPVGIVFGVVLGLVIERLLIRPILAESHFASVLMTIGISVVLGSAIQLRWGSDPRRIDAPFSGNFQIGGNYITYDQLMIIGLGVAFMLGLLFFFRTPWGVQMQAVAEDRVTPRLLGVRVGRVFSVSWGLAAAISTVTLLLHTQASVLTDAAAGPLILKAFVAATIGGFGSATGAFLGGLALGVFENLSGFYINTGSRAAVAMIFVVVILMAKPEGLFSQARPREV
ncbi:branched-chain amino acid ABC transporter permease [Ilumatobacter sp.]|uniref:branched-chain amino acid ABC transporter permease n=1 Tax=Ilumatobacter sp. TaxID=1967498 RepID=UPI003753DA7C